MHRIALWGTGGVGRAAGRMVHDHPDMEVVACFAHGAGKIGKDIGDILEIGPLGIEAVGSVEEILAARPDLVLYMPLAWDVDAMARLLAAGVNIISTANFITGLSYGAGEKQRLIDAAVAGKVSLFGTGINPGFANVLGLFATSNCSRVDSIMVGELVDSTHYASPGSWTSLGYGGPTDAPGLKERMRQRTLVFIDAVEMMGAALKIDLDDIDFDVEYACATRDLDLGYMTIAKDMICGTRMVYSGMKNGKRVIELVMQWYLGDALDKDWRNEGYVVEIKGEPDIRCQYTLVEHVPTGHALPTAANAVHAIPAVIAAQPGLVLASDLPLITAAKCVGPSAG